MPALNGLIEEGVIRSPWNLVLQFRSHLPCMCGVNSVVTCRRREEHRRIPATRIQIMIWGVVLQKGPLGCVIGISIFIHPRSTSPELIVALHVKKRNRRNNGTKEFRILHEHVADKEPTVASTHRSQMRRRGDTHAEEILRHSSKVPV